MDAFLERKNKKKVHFGGSAPLLFRMTDLTIFRELDNKVASSEIAYKNEIKAHAETRDLFARNAANREGSKADQSKIQNQKAEIRRLNDQGMLQNLN